MDYLTKGLTIWSVSFIVLLVIGFALWKIISTQTAFKKNKKAIGFALWCLIISIEGFLFMPILLSNSGELTHSVIDSVQNQIAENSYEKYVKNAKDKMTDAVNYMVKNYSAKIPSPETELTDEEYDLYKKNYEEMKDLVIKKGINYEVQKMTDEIIPFTQSLENALNSMTIDGKSIFTDIPKSEFNRLSDEIFTPYNDEAKKEFFKIPVLSKMFANVVDGTPFEKISGVKDFVEDLFEKTKNGIKTLIPKFFLLLSSIASLLVSVAISIIIYNLKVENHEEEKEIIGDHIFEYKGEN